MCRLVSASFHRIIALSLYGECPLETGLLQSWVVVCRNEGLLARKGLYLGTEILKRLIITSP